MDQNVSPNNPPPKRRWGARIGMLLTAVAALYWISTWTIVDPKVTEHKSIFPFAVMLVCAFAVVMLIISILVGAILGAIVERLFWRQTNQKRNLPHIKVD